jgi:prepilin-type processing-associated H-X9-DG protein
MKPRFSNQRNHAWTRTEVVVVAVVIVSIVIGVARFSSQVRTGRLYSANIECGINLKQVGHAFVDWANDHNDKFPMEISVTNGGTMELAATGSPVTTFQIMSNQFSTPSALFCPADDKQPATDFSTSFTGKNISYFIGLDARGNYPQSIISGDCNLDIGGVPAKPGLLWFSTNSAISWSATRHRKRGHFTYADGSVSQSSLNFPPLNKLMEQTGLATNRLALP